MSTHDRSVYCQFDRGGAHEIAGILRQVKDCPPFTLHLAKVGENDPTVITPLEDWLDRGELGCLQAVHWHPGTVLHLYVETDREHELIAAITAVGGQHVGS